MQPLFFVNTVESDLEASRAAQNIDAKTIQTTVGDKWILWEALKMTWLDILQSFKNSHHDHKEPLKTLINQLQKTLESPQPSSIKLSQTLLQIDKELKKYVSQKEFQQWLSHYVEHEQHFIGAENSGHLVSIGITEDSFFYTGSGIKTGLNTLAIIQEKPSQEFYHYIQNLYPLGYEKSQAIYYIEKALIERSHRFFQTLLNYAFTKIQELWESIQVIEGRIPRRTRYALLQNFFSLTLLLQHVLLENQEQRIKHQFI